MKSKIENTIGILGIISIVVYTYFFNLSRVDFNHILFTYVLLFILFYAVVYAFYKAHEHNVTLLVPILGKYFFNQSSIGLLFILGVLIRLMLLPYTPNLSQDFYRFIWDGHQLISGFNPYLYTPDEMMYIGVQHMPNAEILHSSMGSLSSGHYTNYPPFNQLFFAAAAYLGGDHLLDTVVWMRLFIILADIGVFIYGIRLLKLLGKPLWLIALYYLNPFVMIELTGNLHWEGVMAFLLLGSVYYLIKNKENLSAIFMSAGVLLKLLPLLVLPALLRRLRVKKLVFYYSLCATVVVIGFIPFLSAELVEKYASSIGLWFGSFEFNASVYYVIRALGYHYVGYNIIGVVGKVLPVITMIMVFIISLWQKPNNPETFLQRIVLIFFVYLLLSTTVHPWYLTLPLLFSVFTNYRFMVVWSAVVILSYSAYVQENYQENMLLITLEYLVVLGFFIHDMINSTTRKTTTNRGLF